MNQDISNLNIQGTNKPKQTTKTYATVNLASSLIINNLKYLLYPYNIGSKNI